MTTAPGFSDVRDEYSRLWASMQIDPANRGLFDSVAKRLYASVGRYRAIEKATGVPATFIMVTHEREGDGDFNTYLGNGQSLHVPTTEVPAGRGPFASFEDGALDALKHDGITSVTDWSLERLLYELEAWNGWGYRLFHHINDPYLWARTSNAQRGKYVADNVFDTSVMDVQVGCAGLIASLWALDPSLRLAAAGQAVVPVAGPIAPAPWDSVVWQMFGPPRVPRMAWAQSILLALYPNVDATFPMDGLDGPRTQNLVRRFQRDRNLEVDGVIGPQTETALKAAV